jgi:uncharacterized protein YabE (DUF348 family)
MVAYLNSFIFSIFLVGNAFYGSNTLEHFGFLGTHTYTSRITKTTSIKPTTVEDETLLLGSRKVVVKSQAGSTTFYYKIKKVAGVQVSKKPIKTVVNKKPVAEVLHIGILKVDEQKDQPESIPFDVQTVNDTNMLVNELSTQEGKIGSQQKVYEVSSVKGIVKSKVYKRTDIIIKPTPSIKHIGINYRVGALCVDTFHSDATGSGACSHHHSVSHWIYAYCSTQYQCN